MPTRPSSDEDLRHRSRFAAISHVRLRAYTSVTTGCNTKNAMLCDRSPRRDGPLSRDTAGKHRKGVYGRGDEWRQPRLSLVACKDRHEGLSSPRRIVTSYAASPTHELQNRDDDRDHDQQEHERALDIN